MKPSRHLLALIPVLAFSCSKEPAAVVEQIVEATHSAAVLAGFSRLLCDPNRPWDHPECILERIEGHCLHLNSHLAADDLRHRRELHQSYHSTASELLLRRRSHAGRFLLLAVHSFTPLLAGQRREMELGILFDERHPLAALDLRASLQIHQGGPAA